MPQTEATPADSVTVWCPWCGDELETTSFYGDMMMCSCGRTFLDYGTVRFILDAKVT